MKAVEVKKAAAMSKVAEAQAPGSGLFLMDAEAESVKTKTMVAEA